MRSDSESGDEVLDVPCGHGRIANGLAARGASATGLDASPLFLERARTDAAARGVKVEYIQADMRNLPWEARCAHTGSPKFDQAAVRCSRDSRTNVTPRCAMCVSLRRRLKRFRPSITILPRRCCSAS
jgi:SAM-dependent methyltransferase